ncbi:MAG: DUF559 domain-containing protein [Candidatus Micrarchaeota archaeon]
MEISEAEKRLGIALQQEGLSFTPQYPISEMHVDFTDPENMVVVEVDGPSHDTHRQRKIDKNRDRICRKRGWRVMRVTADQAYNFSTATAKEVRVFIFSKSRLSRLFDFLKWLFAFVLVWNLIALFNLGIPALILLTVAVVAWKKGGSIKQVLGNLRD